MLPRPLQLGPLRPATNLLLAPIAGYCDLAFRTVCREFGGVGVACTDLLSPQGLLRGTATSLDLARTDDSDKPIGMQLYGSDPEVMAQGARWAVEHGATLIDINMGCPVDKVTKKDGGSKLLTDPPRAVEIARRVVRELERCPLSRDQWARRVGNARVCGPGPVPLTCKMRLCWHDADLDAGRACSPGLARALADAGVVGVTVHGRTTEMKFAGRVRLDGIARVVEAVGGAIPVIGNGDVTEPAHALEMIRGTGCAGVMIGRGALSTPWIFRDAWALQTTGRVPDPPDDADTIATVRRFFDLMREHRGDHYAMVQIRRRISWFAKRLGARTGALLDDDPAPDAQPAALEPAHWQPARAPSPVRVLRERVRLAPDPGAVYDALGAYLECAREAPAAAGA